MASNDMASPSVNSVSGDEIQREFGSNHDFVDADHPGCDICGQLRDAGKRALSERSTEAMEDFRRVLAGFTEVKKLFWPYYTGFHRAAEEGHIVTVQFLLGVDPKPDGKAKGDALYWAAEEGHSRVVQALLDVLDVDPKVDVDALNRVQCIALCAAASHGHVSVVEAVLKHPMVNVKELTIGNRRSPLHEAAEYGHTAVVKVLLKHPEFDVNRNISLAGTALHLAVKGLHNGVVEIFLKHPMVDVNERDARGMTSFHWAMKHHRSSMDKDKHWKIVVLFAKYIDGHKLDQEDDFSKTALEYAYVSKDVSIWQVLSRAEPIKNYIEGLYKDRQVYVDAANAILVGAALIASVTFGSWLQPPLNYTIGGDVYSSQSFQGSSSSSYMPKYVDVEHNMALRAFWVFNCLSFYFAMATVVAGACSVIPRKKLFIKRIVQKLRQYLFATSILLGCSVLCVIIAFGIAGSIVLAPVLKFQQYMIVPTAIGGSICLIWLGILLKNIVGDW